MADPVSRFFAWVGSKLRNTKRRYREWRKSLHVKSINSYRISKPHLSPEDEEVVVDRIVYELKERGNTWKWGSYPFDMLENDRFKMWVRVSESWRFDLYSPKIDISGVGAERIQKAYDEWKLLYDYLPLREKTEAEKTEAEKFVAKLRAEGKGITNGTK